MQKLWPASTTFASGLITVNPLVGFGKGSGVVARTIIHWAATLLSAVLIFVRVSVAAYKAHNLDFTHGLLGLLVVAGWRKIRG
mgnify:CR=1 FL=1